MGVYTRFKREAGGFRKLVELLESSPAVRRKKMIEVGMAEDAEYTRQALAFMLNFEDILGLPDMELAEVIAHAPSPRTIAFAIRPLPEDIHRKFIRNSKPTVGAELRDLVTMEVALRDVGAAQLKLIEIARALERKGRVSVKKIPLSLT